VYQDKNYLANLKTGIRTGFDNKLGKIKEFQVTCKTCDKEFAVNERESQFPIKEKYYCSKSCANSRTRSKPNYKVIRCSKD
jgi:hypothetical protein